MVYFIFVKICFKVLLKMCFINEPFIWCSINDENRPESKIETKVMVIPYEIPIINMLCVEQGNYTSDCIELKRNAFIIKRECPIREWKSYKGIQYTKVYEWILLFI